MFDLEDPSLVGVSFMRRCPPADYTRIRELLLFSLDPT
jgi:hypothetical protein